MDNLKRGAVTKKMLKEILYDLRQLIKIGFIINNETRERENLRG